MRTLRLMFLALVLVQTACDDPFGPRQWVDVAETVQLFSLSRADLVGRPSAFDFISQVRLPVEAPGVTGNWDVALVSDGDGLALAPAGAFEGFSSRAAIATTGASTLAEVTEAPRDTAAFRTTPVRIQPNVVYVVRTRRAECGFGSTGFRYAKLRAVEIDPAAGQLSFEYVRNPFCNDRALVPPRN